MKGDWESKIQKRKKKRKRQRERSSSSLWCFLNQKEMTDNERPLQNKYQQKKKVEEKKRFSFFFLN